jgi:hypothetical protein
MTRVKVGAKHIVSKRLEVTNAASAPDTQATRQPGGPKASYTQGTAAPPKATELGALQWRNALWLQKGPWVFRSADREDQRQELRAILGQSFGIDPALIGVKPASTGKSGDAVYFVSVGGEAAAVLKVFERPADGRREAKALTRLEGLTQFSAVKNLGEASLVEANGAERLLLLMEHASGDSLAKRVETLPVDPRQHAEALAALKPHFRRTGEALGELHKRFEGPASGMTGEAKLAWSQWVLAKISAAHQSVGEDQLRAVAATLARTKKAIEEAVLPAFINTRLPGSAAHGDATLFNFVPTDEGVRAFDVGTLEWSFDASDHPIGSGAQDLGRFSEHLRLTPAANGEPALTEAEAATLENAFLQGYATHGHDAQAMRPAVWLARIEFQLAVLRFDPDNATHALERLSALLSEIEAAQ